jgi:hypothetical protein
MASDAICHGRFIVVAVRNNPCGGTGQRFARNQIAPGLAKLRKSGSTYGNRRPANEIPP